MSFLGDIVNSIGSNKLPAPQPKATSRPASANTDRSNHAAPKPASRPQLPANLSGAKRKGEDNLDSENGKSGKLRQTASAGTENRKGPAPPLNAPKSGEKASFTSRTDTTIPSSLVSVKPNPATANANTATAIKPGPSKGSYADLMARAKQAAEHRPQGQAGGIKHQTTVKDKPSKLAEKRREEQEKLKAQKAGKVGTQVQMPKSRSSSPQKGGAGKKEVKTPKTASKPGYKGTMGISTSRGKPYQDVKAKESRYDEYLGTDEEDESGMEQGGDNDDYGSDASSDMEAGFDDMEGEEMSALRAAKADDARELALENQLKKEKEERRRRLEQAAAKRR